VHIHRILMVRRGHYLCLIDTLHFLKITPNKTTLSHNYQVWGHTSFLVYVVFFWCCVLCPMLLVSPVCLLLIASLILSNVYIFHENMYLRNLRSPVLHVQKSKFSLYLQCLKWTVAQSPNATNILFGRPKAAPN
jgi:hypothetical protein